MTAELGRRYRNPTRRSAPAARAVGDDKIDTSAPKGPGPGLTPTRAPRATGIETASDS
ncbi:hypothetical protein [Massilia sp. KIM]|uniref:hypothetical protein n=1 Tax=Massilia sp. KIM TaxID=1955422 RepID=UPI0015C3602E|nr:hypothetical protein [Massilia sp. KIM]